VTAHSIGNYEDAAVRIRVRVEGVFVAFPDSADIGSGRYGEMHLQAGLRS